MTLVQWLENLDRILFILIQHDSDHAILDRLMPFLRDPYTWIPLYAFMLYYAIRKTGPATWPFILLSLLTVAITDSVTTQVLKPLIGRLRPCHDPVLSSVIREVIECGGLYSMPSSHAANHFGLASFWYFSIRTMSGKEWRWLWIWAAAVSYAQIYVGKHYPFDIIAGLVMGCITGTGISLIFNRWWNKQAVFPKYKLMA